jgi:3-methyl-2-oxobutanoate hydroxymethyltransferase
VLVINDLLGLSGEFRPKFVKRFANLEPLISEAVKGYITEVKENKFPGPEHSF